MNTVEADQIMELAKAVNKLRDQIHNMFGKDGDPILIHDAITAADRIYGDLKDMGLDNCSNKYL
jgi:hypothetical protein